MPLKLNFEIKHTRRSTSKQSLMLISHMLSFQKDAGYLKRVSEHSLSLLVLFQRAERPGWESEERACPDSSPHLLRWSVKLCCCYEKPQHGHWQWSFTFLSGDPTLKGDLIRKLLTDSTSPCVVNLLELGFTVGGKRPPPPPCSSLSQCFPLSLPLVRGRMPFWTPLTPLRCSVRACGRTTLSPSAWVPL